LIYFRGKIKIFFNSFREYLKAYIVISFKRIIKKRGLEDFL